jgi:hypothetical protein
MSRFIVPVAVAVLVACGFWLQLQVHLWQDVSWITHSAVGLLDGQRFGSDIIDPNPPLIWFFSLPAAALVRFAGLSEPLAIRLYVFTVCLLALLLCHHVLGPMRAAGRRLESTAIFLGIAAAITLLPAGAFAQREFISFALGSPYCLLIAGRVAYGAVFPRWLTGVVGVLAGIAFGFKPWLLAVPFALEMLHFASYRSLKSCIRPETLGLSGVLLAYVAAVFVLTPDYLTTTLPLAREVYWLYGRKDATQLWLPLAQALEPAAVAALFFAITRAIPSHAWALFAALLGFTVNYWFQYKAFDYHLYPVTATSAVLLLYASAHTYKAIRAAQVFRSHGMQALGLFTAACLVFMQLSGVAWYVSDWFELNHMERGKFGITRQALIDRVKVLTDGTNKRVYAFSTSIYPAFPTMSYVNAEWISASPCQFPISTLRKRGKVTDLQRDAIDRAAASERARVRREFQKRAPDIVLVRDPGFHAIGRRGAFSFVDFYSADAEFAAMWKNYHEVQGSGLIRIYLRDTHARVAGR